MSEAVFTDTPSDRFTLMCLQAKLGVCADGLVGPNTLQALMLEHGEEMTVGQLCNELHAFHQTGNPSRALLLYAERLEFEKWLGMAEHIENIAEEMEALVHGD